MAKKRKKAVKKKRTTKRKSSGKKSGLATKMCSMTPALQEIVKAKQLSRPQIVKRLWAYIKSHKCQDAKNRRMINPDSKLAKVLGSRPVDMLKMTSLVSKHIK